MSEEFFVKVSVHQGSVLSPLLFVMVVDEVTENARKGWMKQILYADDLVLMVELWKNCERALMNGERRLKAKG